MSGPSWSQPVDTSQGGNLTIDITPEPQPQIHYVRLPDGRTVGMQAASPEEAVKGARVLLAREQGEKKGKEGGIDNFGRSLARGASFGLADEIAAAGDATVQPLLDLILRNLKLGSTNTSTAPSWSERYTENLAGNRGQDKAYDEEFPVWSTTGKLGGGVAGAVSTLPQSILRTPTLLRAATTGAGLGGVTGFNEGEGGFLNRLESGGEGAAIGAILGPTVQAGAEKIVSPILRAAATSGPGQAVINNVVKPGAIKIADILDLIATKKPAASVSAAAPDSGPLPSGLMADLADTVRNATPNGEDIVRRAAAERLATAAQRAKMTPEQIRAGLSDVGPVGMLADVDNQFMRTARAAHTMPGETNSLAETAFKERAKGTGPRLRSAIEGSEPPPSDYALMGEGMGFDSYRRAVAQRAYGAMDEAGFKNSPGISRMIEENPQVAAAVDRVLASEAGSRAGTDRAPASVVDLMHKVKREIQNIGLDNGRPNATSHYWQQTGNEFVDALKRANPALAQADREFAAAASLPDFYTAGANFTRSGMSDTARKSSIGALDDLLQGADPLQVLSARAGTTNAMRDETGGRIHRALNLARLIDESEDVRTKLVQMYGGEHAQQIFRAVQRELRMTKTASDVTAGSKTADKLAEVFDGGMDTGNFGVRVSPGGIAPRFIQHLSDITRRVMAPNEAVRNEIGRMTLNPDQVQNLRTIELIDEILRQRARGGRAATVGGTAGGQLPSAFAP